MAVNMLSKQKYCQPGYTLPELLLTLLLLLIVSLFAIPSWNSWLNLTAAATEVNALVTAIDYARSEAIKRRVNVSICASIDGRFCSGTWTDGYLIFANNNKAAQLTDAKDIIRFHKNTLQQGKMIWHESGLLNISPLGYLYTKNGVFTYCPQNKDWQFAREIIVSMTGRIRISNQLTRGCD